MNLQSIVKNDVYEISIHVHQRNGKYTCGFTMGVEVGGKKELKSLFNLPSIEALEVAIAATLEDDDDDFL